MPFYKDLNNKVHFLDDDKFAYMLHEGCIPITEEEAETLRPIPVVIIPPSVTMRQARIALLQAGLLSAVNAAIANMPGTEGEAARIEWEFSNEVKREQPLVIAMKPLLGLDDSQLDALFLTASKL